MFERAEESSRARHEDAMAAQEQLHRQLLAARGEEHRLSTSCVEMEALATELRERLAVLDDADEETLWGRDRASQSWWEGGEEASD
eukprot:345646-Alexandrium_andersonii.AAC.1